jgi:hypothetical protein
MPRTGLFGGFPFDPEVFAEYMAEQPTWNDVIIASGIISEDNTIMDLIGTKGNVATLPFYQAIDADATGNAPLNNDGLTNNVPVEIAGAKQTAMLIQRMKAWKAKDFTKELTGADPMQHVANSVAGYYRQVWTSELMNILDTVMGLTAMSGHVTDISASGSTVTDDNKIGETSLIYAEQKALGDAADNFGMIIAHSMIVARYKALGLVDYVKYNEANGLQREINLPTIGGLVLLQSDRYTVDASGTVPKYKTTIIGAGSILSARKNNYENPYYTDYDPETAAGVEKLYTKEGRVLHPNGFDFAVGNVATESPTRTELGTAANWSLKFNEKNIRIGQIISNG